MQTEIIKGAILTIGTPVIRSIFGWMQHALSDRTITPFEWRQLGETTIRVGLIAICQYSIAAGFFNIDMNSAEIIATAGSTILTDKIIQALKEYKNVKR